MSVMSYEDEYGVRVLVLVVSVRVCNSVGEEDFSHPNTNA